MFLIIKKILLTTMLLISAIWCNSQKLDTVKAFIQVNDNTMASTGTFTTPTTKQVNGYVVKGGVKLIFLDYYKKPLASKFYVWNWQDATNSFPSVNQEIAALKQLILDAQQEIADLKNKVEAYKAAIPPPITWQFDPAFFVQLPNNQISLKK